MKRVHRYFSTMATVATAIFALGMTAAVAGAAQGVPDGNDVSFEAPTELVSALPASVVVNGAEHVANGIAMRNKESGTIALRGIPAGSTVNRAFLFWTVLDNTATGATNANAMFEGNLIVGVKRADSADPCWGSSGTHTYRANVTPFIPATTPNKDYSVVLGLFAGPGVTAGESPWQSGPLATGPRRYEGATLVVVYKNPNTASSAVYLYDDLNGTMFSTVFSLTVSHAAYDGPGLFTMTGADGQRGSGHDNASSNETSTFNGGQIAGPPVAASDWDGSAGLPLPQLWDVHTHEVEITGSTSTIGYTAGADCLVPVAFVLQQGQ